MTQNFHQTLPFNTLHKARFDSGTDAERPAAPEGLGDAYWSVDTQELYCTDDSGTEWVKVAGAGSGDGGPAAAIRVSHDALSVPNSYAGVPPMYADLDSGGLYDGQNSIVRVPADKGGVYAVTTLMMLDMDPISDMLGVYYTVQVDGQDVSPVIYRGLYSVQSSGVYLVGDNETIAMRVVNNAGSNVDLYLELSAHRIGDEL